MASRYAYSGLDPAACRSPCPAASNSISKMPVMSALKEIVIVSPAGASFAMS